MNTASKMGSLVAAGAGSFLLLISIIFAAGRYVNEGMAGIVASACLFYLAWYSWSAEHREKAKLKGKQLRWLWAAPPATWLLLNLVSKPSQSASAVWIIVQAVLWIIGVGLFVMLVLPVLVKWIYHVASYNARMKVEMDEALQKMSPERQEYELARMRGDKKTMDLFQHEMYVRGTQKDHEWVQAKERGDWDEQVRLDQSRGYGDYWRPHD